MTNKEETHQKGFRKKPLWIYGVAILFICTPLIHLMMTLKNAGETEWWLPHVWWTWIQYLNPAPAVVSGLLCLAGISMLIVRQWSWWMGMIALTALSIYNISLITHSFSDDPFIRILATLGNIGLLVLLFFSDFKQPFFNRRLRWWESESRYSVNIPVRILNTSGHALLVDISKSGIYLESYEEGKELDIPLDVEVEVNSELTLHCAFSRTTSKGSAFKFVNITKHQSRYLRQWIKLLSKDPHRRVR